MRQADYGGNPVLTDREWMFVKARTAADDGAVWRSTDGTLFMRTGGPELVTEAAFLAEVLQLGYPVPRIVDVGQGDDGRHYVVERSVGTTSLHELAVTHTAPDGLVGPEVPALAAGISSRLLAAQARAAGPGADGTLAGFLAKAGFTDSVYAENPDLDTPRVHALAARALDRLGAVPMCASHLDYGLPNAFERAVIDWQHHGLAPLGFDVYPMLELVPFKGGAKGYRFTVAQRTAYLAALDQACLAGGGPALSPYLGEFLLVKCFFFLALMRPTAQSRPDKHAKWQYRRALFTTGLEQYESTGTIDTAAFPTFAEFTGRLASAARP